MVYPLLLGSGKTLFDSNGHKTLMPLREARTVGDGVIILTCGPSAELPHAKAAVATTDELMRHLRSILATRRKEKR